MIKDIQDKILARSVHGGSTGLEQQMAKRYPQKLKPAEYKYPFIKEEVKKNHDIDLVFMAGGIVGYHCVEEDAEYMKKKFNSKNHDRGGRMPYIMCTVPYGSIKRWANEFNKEKIKFAFLQVVDPKSGIRKIVKSSDTKLIGLRF